MTNKPLVSVNIVTYNHVNYIKRSLEGILSQQTNFSVEIILGEDDSNDGTRDICKEFANKYPNRIKLFLRSRKDVIYINDRPTGRYNFIENLKKCQGKYIALCEGDDYWTDPLKLQKQVDFLEQNIDYSICAHTTLEFNEFNKKKNRLIPAIDQDTDFRIEDYIINNKTATCSLLYIRQYFDQIPSWFYSVPFGDLSLVLTILKWSNKKVRVFNECMSVYRIHDSGIHGALRKDNLSLIRAYLQHLETINIISDKLLFEKPYKKYILTKKRNTYAVLAGLYKFKKDNINFIRTKTLYFIYKAILMKQGSMVNMIRYKKRH